ncbi:MAG: hypothetical protein U0169_17045 [Polyangiaceae bacterium]
MADASAITKGGGGGDELPAGHPDVGGGGEGAPESGDPHGGNPHGNNPHASGGQADPMQRVPEDGSEDSPLVPVGTLRVEIRDANELPVPRTLVNLGIIKQSIADGDKREHLTAMSDASGIATFSGREIGSAFAYRVSVNRDGATFAATPFRLGDQMGNRTVLHVYPVTRKIEEAIVAMQAIVYAEVKDDRIQFQQAFSIFNLGSNAWVPENLVIDLPEGFTALSAGQEMSDVGIDPVEKRGARLKGTFGPGRHDLEFRWQLPHDDGSPDVVAEIGLPPNVAAARVMAPASSDMRLVVAGFPEPVVRTDGQGQRILSAEKEFRRTDPPVKSLRVEIRDLPTAGPGRVVASTLASLVVLGGIVFAVWGSLRTKERLSTEDERNELLAELAALEKAFASGEIGPKTHERARKALLHAIARTFVEGPEVGAKPVAG